MCDQSDLPPTYVEFPEWAPEALLRKFEVLTTRFVQKDGHCERLNYLNTDVTGVLEFPKPDDDEGLSEYLESQMELLLKLTTDKRMEAVWVAILKRLAIPNNTKWYTLRLFNLLFRHAVYTPEWELSTKAERKKWKDDMRTACKTLKDGFSRFPTIGQRFRSETLSTGSTTNLHSCLNEVDSFLVSLSTNDALISRPNAQNVDRLYFVRRLGEHFIAHFGQPLNQHIATIATIVLDEPIDKDAVVSMLAPLRESKSAD
jgi:hypothetical protein